jgi:carboxymethylenebutenolidase
VRSRDSRHTCDLLEVIGGRLEEHLTALGIAHDVDVHAGAGHSFMTEGHHPVAKLVMFPLHIGHAQPAADDAWQRTFTFFDCHIANKPLGS